MRICSLVPSGTEIVCALGLADSLVAVSHNCDYPPVVIDKPVVSSLLVPKNADTSAAIDAAIDGQQAAGHRLYELDADLARALALDLILTQELCEVCAVPSSLAHELASSLFRQPRVFSLQAATLGEILSNIQRLGLALGRGPEAELLVADLRGRIDRVAERSASGAVRPRVAFVEWLDPLWLAGNWIPELIELAGGTGPPLVAAGQRSLKVSWAELEAFAPEVLLVAPCGFQADRTLRELTALASRPEWQALPAVRAGRAYALDGSLWCRHGPRIAQALEVMASLIQPDLSPAPVHSALVQPVPLPS